MLAPASRACRDGDMEAGMHIFVDTVFGSGGYRALSELLFDQWNSCNNSEDETRGCRTAHPRARECGTPCRNMPMSI